ncbi:MAG: hypothetical protein WB776_06230, partial [Candidatus Sulfotelmatobacter sp.]
ATTILEFLAGLRGTLSLTFEEGTWAAWLYDLLKPHNDGHYVTDSNKDHNHDLKGLFKAAATRASVQPGPFQDFYQRSLAKGIQPTMARLTLACKIAAITLTLWKKGENFDAEKLKAQAA